MISIRNNIGIGKRRLSDIDLYTLVYIQLYGYSNNTIDLIAKRVKSTPQTIRNTVSRLLRIKLLYRIKRGHVGINIR